MQTGWRRKRDWTWAKQWGSLFKGILPDHVCEAAMATCTITLQGPESVGRRAKNWGQWIRMRMQTFGHIPNHLSAAVQKSREGISTDSREAVEVILDCFGLTLDDVFSYYGVPETGEKMTLNLCDIVARLDADYAATADASELELVA